MVQVFLQATITVWTRIVQYVGRNFRAIHCMSHRLHLILRHAIDTNILASHAIQGLEQLFRELYNFVQKKQGQQNRAFIQKFAEEMEYVLYKIPKLFEGRWVLSEYNVVSKIIKSWEAVVKGLEEYKNHVTEAVSDTADHLISHLTDQNLLVTMHFFRDLTGVMDEFSAVLQQTSVTVVGKFKLINSVYEQLEQFSENVKVGGSLEEFIAECVCEKQMNGECTLETYETSSVRIKGVLLNDEDNKMRLTDLLAPFVAALLQQYDYYFPRHEFQTFEIFVAANFPCTQQQLELYGRNEITAICRYFAWQKNIAAIFHDWVELVKSIIEKPSFMVLRQEEPHVFWKMVMDDDSYSWTELSRELVESVLALPIGTQDVEQAYSIMNDFKTSTRSRMTTATLEANLRIRFNGNSGIETWHVYHYIKTWVEANHCLADDKTLVVVNDVIQPLIYQNKKRKFQPSFKC